jgi:hypothetical protein
MAQDNSTPPIANAAKQPALTQHIYDLLDQILAGPRDEATLHKSLRLLGKWRAKLIENDIVRHTGGVIARGPFAGMIYGNTASEGSSTARLLGAYEASLAPVIEQIVSRPYARVIDVGCAEGYYAVGLARRMPKAHIMARDIMPDALHKCQKLARANGVEGQISYGGAVTHSDFDICQHAKTVIICDIEGGEGDLLDPAKAPGLLAADILVETHDGMRPNLSNILAQRFAPSHDVQVFHRSIDAQALPEWMHSYSDLDRLLALWEWRAGPTPWLWMKAKHPPAPQQDTP